MNLRLPILGIFTLSAFLHTTPSFAEDPVLAVVNGMPITQSYFNAAAEQSKIDPAQLDAQSRGVLLEALINRMLVLSVAEKESYDKRTDVADNLKALREGYIASHFLAEKAETFPISDEDIKSYYDKAVAANPPMEYHARHILLDSEETAKEIIKKIADGGDFTKLAEENSKDPGTAPKGGDLGWFKPATMVPQFSKAVAAMQKGDVTELPVQTQFGWHVIKLEDTREGQAPALDDVKVAISNLLLKERLNDYLDGLRAAAKVEIKPAN